MRILIGLLLVVACGECNEEPEPIATTTEAPEETLSEEVAPEEVAPPEPRAKPATPTAAQLVAIRLARDLLREGRRLAREANWGEAATKFRASIEGSDSASARCELGWALFQQAQLEEAKRELERGAALLGRRRHRERERNTLAACLYNLGRVVEASDPEAAADYYRESLAVRPNETVVARLEQLGVDEPAPTSCEPVRCEGPFTDENAARDELGLEVEDEEDGADDGYDDEDEVVAYDDVTGSSLIDTGSELVAVVHYEPSWFACELGQGSHGSMTSGSTSSAQWIAGGDPEITFDFDVSDSGHEEGINNTMGNVHRFFIGRRGDDVVVYGSLLVLDYYDDGMLTNCDCEEEWDNPGCCDIEDISSSTWTRVAYADSGQLRLTHGGDGRNARAQSVEVVHLEELGCPNGDSPAGDPRD